MHKSYLVGKMTYVLKSGLWALAETLSINFDNLKYWYQSRIIALFTAAVSVFFSKIDYIFIDSNKMCKFCKKWVLLKPGGSQGPPLARAQGPLVAQVSY